MKNFLLALALLATTIPLHSQNSVTITQPGNTVFIVPHMRPVTWRPSVPNTRPVEVTNMRADIVINGLRAITTLTVSLDNPTHLPQESVVLLPIPPTATVTSLTLDGVQGNLPATLLPKDEARQIYDDIVRQAKDPALLEFAGTGLVKSSVFPVAAYGQTAIQLVYEEILPAESGESKRIDYTLPRSESPTSQIPWTIHVKWTMPGGHAALYSPSHPVTVDLTNPGTAEIQLHSPLQPGPFRLSAMPRTTDNFSTSVIAYPEAGTNSGTFMLLLAPPVGEKSHVMKREVTIVFDRSGSMAGEKMYQARAAALQILEGLEDGEAFNIITYNEAVNSLFETPQIKTPATTQTARDYITAIRVSGGTNIHGALQRALTQPATPGMLPVILFFTDGLPTIAETSEKTIRDEAKKSNTAQRRIFTFGLGADVNTPLLASLSSDSRATTTFVLPKEDVEVKVMGLFRKLAGPVISTPQLTILDSSGNPAPSRVSDIVPLELPDLYLGDLHVILGQFHGTKPMTCEISGKNAAGKTLTTQLNFHPQHANLSNAHLPRLWATRRIAILSQAIRDLGAQANTQIDTNDPRTRELIDEIVRLSLHHGIMTEYTSFLARETQPIAHQPSTALQEASSAYQTRSIDKRSGIDSVNQELNLEAAKNAASLNKSNRQWDAHMKETTFNNVAQIADKTFYRRNGSWVDSETNMDISQAVTITPDDPQFHSLVNRLVHTNRQSALALDGDILINDNNTLYRITKSNP